MGKKVKNYTWSKRIIENWFKLVGRGKRIVISYKCSIVGYYTYLT